MQKVLRSELHVRGLGGFLVHIVYLIYFPSSYGLLQTILIYDQGREMLRLDLLYLVWRVIGSLWIFYVGLLLLCSQRVPGLACSVVHLQNPLVHHWGASRRQGEAPLCAWGGCHHNLKQYREKRDEGFVSC